MSNTLVCQKTKTTCLVLHPREAAKTLGIDERLSVIYLRVPSLVLVRQAAMRQD